jgi:hypothetical protein
VRVFVCLSACVFFVIAFHLHPVCAETKHASSYMCA